MLIKKGEVLTIASGIYEGYDRAGPFVATQDFDLAVFVASAKDTVDEAWENAGLMYQIPRMLFAQGLVVMKPCRRIYLGWTDLELGEEEEDFP
ncbi:hypothetical protein [Pseudomonas japonica]|uniref:hypothetical protein n=1 Tax=Pseudomonas japonica TaxID=256466 RepID=UPI0015E27F3D|nr:hypothetical protein [Pseudomonas japonica]MBA1244935.1 hypothetical protein [Pseudomonas japonica]